MPDTPALSAIVSCEHGGNHVPSEYAPLFAPYAALLQSHQGWDPGALYMARYLSRALGAPLLASETTRLLVDLNRSPDSSTLFSDITRSLPPSAQKVILEMHYRPYREEVEQAVTSRIRQGQRVLHISSHSFTPALDGKVRETEIGLLYDPARSSERKFCDLWLDTLQAAFPDKRVRRNYPYRGTADGLTAYLRTRHGGESYMGIELETNQNLVGSADWTCFCREVAATLARSVAAATAAMSCGPDTGR